MSDKWRAAASEWRTRRAVRALFCVGRGAWPEDAAPLALREGVRRGGLVTRAGIVRMVCLDCLREEADGMRVSLVDGGRALLDLDDDGRFSTK